MIKRIESKSQNLLKINLKQFIYEQQRSKRYLKQPKPLWKPISVQRLFNIPPVKKYLEEDEEQLKKEEELYLDQYRSIKEYFNREFTIPILQGGSNIELKKVEEEHRRLIEENNRENERIAKQRAERLKSEQMEEDLVTLKKQLIENEEYQIKKEQAANRILKEKERYSTYITKDKLKDAIQTAIDHPASYEFAIDLNGTLVFDKKLHPYALNPSDPPDSSDVISDYVDEQNQIQLTGKKLYYD